MKTFKGFLLVGVLAGFAAPAIAQVPSPSPSPSPAPNPCFLELQIAEKKICPTGGEISTCPGSKLDFALSSLRRVRGLAFSTRVPLKSALAPSKYRLEILNTYGTVIAAFGFNSSRFVRIEYKSGGKEQETRSGTANLVIPTFASSYKARIIAGAQTIDLLASPSQLRCAGPDVSF